jgi:uncharacterized protein (DUF302 family)
MNYYISKKVDMNFEQTEEKIRGLLKEQGFGVLTEIDVQITLKKKLDVDFRKYKILGACNPPYAHKALLAEDKIGLMLPCNVILQETYEGKIEVAAIDPIAGMSSVGNDKLSEIALQIREKLQTVINNL